MNFVHYADDSSVYMVDDQFVSPIRYTNYDLDKTDNWICANKPSLNTSEYSITCLLIANTVLGMFFKSEVKSYHNVRV